MDDLAAWLLERIAEDEAAARVPWPHVYSAVQTWWDDGEDEPGYYAADQTDDVKGLAKTLSQILRSTGIYARVLAECDAKRRIVRTMSTNVNRIIARRNMLTSEMQDYVLRLLALPYADRPGYRSEWAP